LSIFIAGEKLEQVFSGGVFTEGPAADQFGNVFFSDCSENIIYVYSESENSTRVWSADSGHANGMNFDFQGRLVTCCDGKKYDSSTTGGAHAVRRYESNGEIVDLATSFNGKKLNGPNDLCFDEAGNIYFTDPRYGFDEDIEQDCMAVYKIDKDLNITRVISDLQYPNGILISKDNQKLYLVDHNPKPGGKRTLEEYTLQESNWKWNRTLLDFQDGYGMDGMVLDTNGNLYVTGGEGEKAGVYVIDPEGNNLGFIATGEIPGNCTFGGKKLDTLYIAASTSLYRIKLNAQGHLAFPRIDNV
jgi:gluconolactonase